MATPADYYLQYVEALDAIAADVTDWESEEETTHAPTQHN